MSPPSRWGFVKGRCYQHTWGIYKLATCKSGFERLEENTTSFFPLARSTSGQYGLVLPAILVILLSRYYMIAYSKFLDLFKVLYALNATIFN